MSPSDPDVVVADGAALAIEPLLATALTRSAHEGARIVALHWLGNLVVARTDWAASVREASHAADPDAVMRIAVSSLHKARVGLRRLRATLREHRESLGLDEGRRFRRMLRRLSRVSGRARDRDVQREWLDVERDGLSPAAGIEADTMLQYLSIDISSRQARVSRMFEKTIDRDAERLAAGLARFTTTHVVGQSDVVVPFARHLADRVDRGAAHLRHNLSSIDGVHAQHTLHRIRIRLKRQRAMLAPFSRTEPSIGAWYALATQGQDLLGAMRDASLLADESRARGCAALADVLQGVALGHFEAFADRWCRDADAVMHIKDAASQTLRAIADCRGMSHVTDSPASRESGTIPVGHGLPMEIERKYLLHGLPPQAAMAPAVRIEQGWLPGTVLRERLRRTISMGGTSQCTRTIKLGQPGARIEVEEPTDPALFDALWPLTIDARIRKRRHLVREGTVLWEVDVFLDRDLVLAEVELESTAQHVQIPEWLTPFVVREVTHDPAYLNAVMARRDVSTPDRTAR